MHTQLSLLVLLSASLTACGRRDQGMSSGASNADLATFNGAKVEVVAEGGIAALATNHSVRHDDRFFVFVRRHICSANCAAPMDSASGTLAPAAADSLFGVILSQSPFELKDDYGPTRGGADMMGYTVRITSGGKTKTVHADDGTMPPPMRRIVEAVRETISGARR